MKKLLVSWLVASTLGCGREVSSGGACPAIAQAGLDVGVRADEMASALCDAVVTASTAPAPSADPRPPPPTGRCVGTVAEYCASLGGPCPTYRQSVERATTLCTHWAVTTRACGRRYRSVSWREPLLGGGEEYFDPGGRLMAAHLFTDYGAYCNRSSFSQTFGRIPTCPTTPLATDACRREAQP